jgi:hypothetical protein
LDAGSAVWAELADADPPELAAVTTGVGADVALVEPREFVALTITRIVWPSSARLIV